MQLFNKQLSLCRTACLSTNIQYESIVKILTPHLTNLFQSCCGFYVRACTCHMHTAITPRAHSNYATCAEQRLISLRECGAITGELIRCYTRTAVDRIVKLDVIRIGSHELIPIPLGFEGGHTEHSPVN